MRKLLSFVSILVSFYSYSQSLCGGSSTVIQATNPNNMTGTSFSLNPGGFTSASGNFTISPPGTTTYTLYTTGTPSAGGSPTTTSFVTTVTVFPQPVVAPTYTQANCTSTNNLFNFHLTFNPASPAPTYTINWPVTVPLGIISPTQFTAANTTPGPYTAEVTAAGGCSTTVLFTITPPPALANYTVIPFGTAHTITCIQPTVTLTPNNPNLTYTWSSTSFTPIVSPTISIDATMLGTITSVGENTVSHCTTTYSFVVTQNITTPTANINPTSINLTCSQASPQTVSVSATPSVNIVHYILSPTGGVFSAPSYTAIYQVGGIGVFTHVAVNSANGCSATPQHFTVSSSQAFPTYSLSSPQSFTIGCSSKSLAVVNIVDFQGTGGGGVTFTVIGPPTGTAITTNTALSSISVYSMTVPGTWTVIVRDNTNQCETRTPFSIIQRTFPPDISVAPTRTILNCLDSTTVLQGQSLTSPVSYNWSFPFAPGNLANSSVLVNAIMANHTQSLVANFTLSVTDNSNLCVSTQTLPVYQNIYLPVSIIATSHTAIACNQATLTLNNQSTWGIPAGHPLFPRNQPVSGFKWYGPSPQEPAGPSTSYLGATVGIYTLVAMDLNNFCRSTGTLEIFDNRIYPTINFTEKAPKIDCGAISATLDPTYVPSNVLNYKWTSVVTGSANVDNGPKYYPNSIGVYSVTVTNTLNGCKMTNSVEVTNGALNAKFSLDKETGYAPSNIVFTNQSSSTDPSTGTKSITSIWDFGNGYYLKQKSDSFAISPPAKYSTYTQPGTYTITLYVSKGTCLDTAVHYIKLDIPSSLEVPNVFTPNDDGINDIYFLKTANLSEVTMTIYDRWGHLTYELTAKDKENVAWDGKNQYGKNCAEGTYFYILKATGKDGTAYDKKGSISLIR